jgi:lysophospholipase L1-like esterase
MGRALARTGTVVLSFLIALEVGLRIYNPFPFRVRGDHIFLPAHQSYAISHPGSEKLEPVTYVRKNSLGFRGPEPPRDWSGRLTILTIGGSTTECLFNSDGKAWTDQFARRLAAVRSDTWVNNAGFEGHSTFGHLVLLREYVLSMRPRVAIFLIGVNDMKIGSPRPVDNNLNPDNLSAAHRTLTFMADHSEIAAVAENLIRMRRTYEAGVAGYELRLSSLQPRYVERDHEEDMIAEHRAKYLQPYAKRVSEIIRLTRQAGIEPVLVTQPALYGDVTDPTTGTVIATAGIGIASNAHVEWRILELYNDVTRRLAHENGVHLVDLGREMPKDSRYFWDWIHFTNEGAVVVGDIVFDRLREWLTRSRH